MSLSSARGLDPVVKKSVIQKFQRKANDSGSPEVQIALLTTRLQKLMKHFEKSPKDNHSRRGMLQIISKRKGLLEYLRRDNPEGYRKTVAALGLRK